MPHNGRALVKILCRHELAASSSARDRRRMDHQEARRLRHKQRVTWLRPSDQSSHYARQGGSYRECNRQRRTLLPSLPLPTLSDNRPRHMDEFRTRRGCIRQVACVTCLDASLALCRFTVLCVGHVVAVTGRLQGSTKATHPRQAGVSSGAWRCVVSGLCVVP